MGKGDKKSKKGKRKKSSFGNSRNSNSIRRKKVKLQKKREKKFFSCIGKMKKLCVFYNTLALLENEYNDRIAKDSNDQESIQSIENIGKSKIKTIELLNEYRNKHPPYSIEEIFVNNGQYDRFVTLEFFPESEAYIKYGKNLMGVFIFTQYERKHLKRYIGQSQYIRTSRKIRFNPSEVNRTNQLQNEELRNIGIDNRDIKLIYNIQIPHENRYKKRTGYKELPNKLEISIKTDGYNYRPIVLQIYKERIETGNFPLISHEYNEYLALKYQYDNSNLTNEEKKIIFKSDGHQLKPEIASIYIKHKFYTTSELDPEENEIFQDHLKRLTLEAKKAVDKEIMKSSSDSLLSIISKDFNKYSNALMLATQFEPINLSTYGAKYSVSLELPEFLHIFLRHSKGYQFGDWVGTRTAFEYKIKDVIKILKTIVRDNQDKIDKALTAGMDFHLVKGTAYLYDGNYYAIHISSEGKLLSFHQRNK